MKPRPYRKVPRWLTVRYRELGLREINKKTNYYVGGEKAANRGAPYTEDEDELVLAQEITDRALAARIGRSIMSIQVRRVRLRARKAGKT